MQGLLAADRAASRSVLCLRMAFSTSVINASQALNAHVLIYATTPGICPDMSLGDHFVCLMLASDI